MNILNSRIFVVEYYRYNLCAGKHDVHIFRCSRLQARFAIFYHRVRNFFSDRKIYCRIIGSYVR